MKKSKKHLVQIVNEDKSDEEMDSDQTDSDNENEDNDAYDSMIENGTSESSDDEDDDDDDDDNENNDDDDEDEDDFENEENDIESNKIQEQNKMKRKHDDHSVITDDSAASLKKLKKSSRHLYKQPTVEEMNELRETENLFHSNLFRMQINEMLKEIQIKDKHKNYIEMWLKEFNEFLNKLKIPKKEKVTNTSNTTVNNNLSWLQNTNIQIPFNILPNMGIDEKLGKFEFLKSNKKAFIIGSYRTGTIISSLLNVDICILIPSNVFQKEDYLNLLYDKKRALYLTYIASKLNEENTKNERCELRFNWYRNNPLKPILEIKPNDKIGKKMNFRIFACPDDGTFKLNRFVPWNSNIRCKLFDEHYKNPDDEPLLATPNYNVNILHDLTIKSNHLYLEKVLSDNKNLQEGIILLKIWLKQRNLDHGYSGFSSFIITMFVVYLFKTKKLHKAMSSYQIARNTWNYLAVSAWNEDGKGISLCDDLTQANQPTLEQFHTYYDVVFIDTTGFQNITANLSLDLYFRIKLEAQYAIELLNNKNINSFQLLFMKNIPIYTYYDQILKISNKRTINDIVKNQCEKSDKYNFVENWYPIVLKMITNILRKGLSDRIISMVPIEIESESWNIYEIPKKLKQTFCIGFILDHIKALDIMNKGPEAKNEIESEEFRKFWGKKSKLRRFQDGSIVEACVWSSKTDILSQKRNIVKKIIFYLLNNHLKIQIKKLHYFGMEFDSVYTLNDSFYLFENNKMELIDAESATLNVIKTFDELGKNLRELNNDLPLNITGIQCISSVNRYCDPIPIINNAKSYLHENRITIFQSYKIIDGIIELSTSGKWPDELAAFKRMKCAFHLEIARKLRTKYKYETRGAIEGVYILINGYVFRLEIAHQKEIQLTQIQEKNDNNNDADGNNNKNDDNMNIVTLIDTSISLELNKKFNLLPKLTSILHGLYQQYTSFGPAVMIAKRWLYSHMIDSYLWPDECTELLIAFIYINVQAYKNTFQPQIGFLRFLHILSTTDWKNDMFLLNFNDEMTHEEITHLENKFNTERDKFPPLTLITSIDKKRYNIWSNQHTPSIQILSHLKNLSTISLQIIENNYLNMNYIKIDKLFTPNLDGYDVIIYLRTNRIQTSLVNNNFENKNKSKNKKKNKIDSTVPAAGFNPVEIGLKELREGYSEFAVFFNNPCGGRFIGVIWKPNIFIEKIFKVNSVNGCTVTKNGKLKCNRKLLIEDFKIILRDLYYAVEDRSNEDK